MTHSHDIDHDTDVVVEDRSGSSGVFLGVIALILLLAAIWWFALGPGTGRTTTDKGGGTQPVPSAQAPASNEPAPSVAAPSP
jgi:hypothetical protein